MCTCHITIEENQAELAVHFSTSGYDCLFVYAIFLGITARRRTLFTVEAAANLAFADLDEEDDLDELYTPHELLDDKDEDEEDNG